MFIQMRLSIPIELQNRLREALQKAGRREIGGVMMAERIGHEAFRLDDITVQMNGGGFAWFVRLSDLVIEPLKNFFRKREYVYTRFNYLGEWHSHHSFSLVPSSQDLVTMLRLVQDESVGAHFVCLLLVRLGDDGALEFGLTTYLPSGEMAAGQVTAE
jgi:hypothetical protein